MRRLIKLLVATLLIASVFTVPVLADGGQGTNAVDVCWMQGTTEYRATFTVLPNGIVQQFRYEPTDMHGVFKPAESFDEPDEGSYRLWLAHDYDPCEGSAETEYTIADVLNIGEYYWVQLEPQY